MGVAGIISWNIPLEEIYESIHSVGKGRIILKHENVSSSLLIYFREGLNKLNERELSVLKYVAAGHTNREIAERMHVATRTIETYISGVCSKLHARSRTQAAVQAVHLGVIHL
ncbi:MAG: response regulator transcription factor [Chloroflexi bacterium]|nr:response regulator transcription factor [Chloroflexota bacterium]